MKFFHHTTKVLNVKTFSELDYSVLNYEQLLSVNGAGGSGRGGAQKGPSGNPNQQPQPNPTATTEKNQIDNTKHKDIVKKFTGSGYELLSDKKDKTYTDGSRKAYMQSQFEMLKSDTDSFSTVKQEGRFEGVRGGINVPYNDYDDYRQRWQSLHGGIRHK